MIPASEAVMKRLVGLAVAAAVALGTPTLGQERTGAVRISVVPDRADWTYAPGDAARFRVTVTRDGHGLAATSVRYACGPEQMPPVVDKTATVPGDGLVIEGGTMKDPGFLRCEVKATVEGRDYRSVGTAGFAPDRIAPTVENPPDFDAFWAASREALAKLPIDARSTPKPDLSTAKADVYHVSLQNVGSNPQGGTSRFYGILAVPRAEGRFPALMNPPGAGARPYKGLVDWAERGFITLQVGIHGIPVDLEPEVYDSLLFGPLAAWQGYGTFNLDDRDRYYYRRVYLGCVRADDFLVSHPKWDGKNLVVTGGSQGGALSITTAGLDPRVTGLAAGIPGALRPDRLPEGAGRRVAAPLQGREGRPPHAGQDPDRRLLRRGQFRPPREGPRPVLLGLQRRDLPAHLDVRGLQRRHRAEARCSWPSRPATSRWRSRTPASTAGSRGRRGGRAREGLRSRGIWYKVPKDGSGPAHPQTRRRLRAGVPPPRPRAHHPAPRRLRGAGGRRDHPTADQVYDAAAAAAARAVAHDRVPRARDAGGPGLARKVQHAGAVARFDPMTERHHHLVCEGCGRLVDLDDARRAASLPLPDARGDGLPRPRLLDQLHAACARAAVNETRKS